MSLTEEQLEWRRQGIGGSDAPTIVGVNPYQQPYQLYLEKTGQAEPEDLDDNDAVHFGNLFEELVGKEFARRLNMDVRRDNRSLTHPKYPWMRGHIDFRLVGHRKGLECKNRTWHMAKRYGEIGSDQVYEPDLIQAHHYMEILGWDEWYVAVYFGGGDFRWFHIERNAQLAEALVQLEHDFWQCVQQRMPPAIAFEHGTIGVLLDQLYPGTDGNLMTLDQSAEHYHLVARDARERRLRYEKTEETALAHLRDLVGESSVAMLPQSEGGYVRKLVKRKGYEVAPSERIDFKWMKKPPGVTKQ